MRERAASTYIDLLSDFGFKRIFGSEPNKALLIAFLNEIFRGKKQIIDLVYNQNEYPGEDREQGTIIFDLLCTTDKGERILIEVQKSKQENFFQRALFYGSRLISSQIPVGKRQQWGYRFTGVYVIAILDSFILPQALSAHYFHHICLRDRDGGNFVYDDFGLLFIELLKFDKQEQELETDLEKWLYVLKHISTLDKLPLVLCKSVFERLFDIAAYVNLSEKEKTMYDISLKHQWDKEGALLAMRNDLIAEIREEMIQTIRQEMTLKVLQEVELEVRQEVALKVRQEVALEVRQEVALKVRQEVALKVRQEVALEVRQEVALKVRQEVALEERAREKQVKLAKVIVIAKNFKEIGVDFALISQATGLSKEEVSNL